jgi:hypothetical protein
VIAPGKVIDSSRDADGFQLVQALVLGGPGLGAACCHHYSHGNGQEASSF